MSKDLSVNNEIRHPINAPVYIFPKFFDKNKEGKHYFSQILH
jgi:hypothetical protein